MTAFSQAQRNQTVNVALFPGISSSHTYTMGPEQISDIQPLNNNINNRTCGSTTFSFWIMAESMDNE